MAELLWGDHGEAQARSSLRQALRELRHAVNRRHEVICSDREHIWVSADRVEVAPAQSDARRHEAFEDLDDISAGFDEWLMAERNRRAANHLAALKAEAEGLLANERDEESLLVIQQIENIDPRDEDALRLGMQADFNCGRPGAIVDRFEAASALLNADLGIQPSDESRSLRDRLINRVTLARRA
jgi:DNA-binding SARP family transcriptional activator